MNYLATPHSASSPAEAELTTAADPKAKVPILVGSRPIALLFVANRLVAVILASPRLGFEADTWWAQ